MNGVKVTKTVVGAMQVGQHVCLTEGVCLVARVSTGSAVKQCSSAAGTLGPGQREGRGWPVWIRQQVHDKHFFL